MNPAVLRFTTAVTHVGLPTALCLSLACGSSSGNNNGGNNDTETISKATPSGDAQQGNANAALPNPLRVIIRKGTAPVSGKTVDWAVTSGGGGSVNPTTSTTGTDGIATAVVTLGTLDMTITASSTGVTGSPVSFTAGIIGLNAEVTVSNNSFSPGEVTIKAGGTVNFTWGANASQHNVIPDDGKAIPNSGDNGALKSAPFSFSATFTTAGDYFYHCTNHGSTRGGMFGKITVVP